MKNEKWDIIIIGAGPAGLAAALSAKAKGAKVCIIEREKRPGGILKQCIHDGFGLIQFNEMLTGPEYAHRYVTKARQSQLKIYLNSFVEHIHRNQAAFQIHMINPMDGFVYLEAKALIFATGCRERTAHQIFLHGTRPAGIFTAGLAQYMINIQGYMPTKRCVILGSGDIGLIMARRLKLEGADVLGVYEIQNSPSGLTRNIVQCLEDYQIPLHLSKTVVAVHGEHRLEAVTIASVDTQKRLIPGSEEQINCDALILSVGLIPENDLLEELGITLHPHTKGPAVNQNLMSSVNGIFCCGNALHVNDLVDYVSESGETAGKAAADYALAKTELQQSQSQPLNIEYSHDFLYVTPQTIQRPVRENLILYFRSSCNMENRLLRVSCGDKTLLTKTYNQLKPPEMERIVIQSTVLTEMQNAVRLSLEDAHA